MTRDELIQEIGKAGFDLKKKDLDNMLQFKQIPEPVGSYGSEHVDAAIRTLVAKGGIKRRRRYKPRRKQPA